MGFSGVVGRRGLLIAGAGLLVGCSSSKAGAPPTSPPPPASSTPLPSTTPPSSSGTPPLPSVRAWVPGPSEVAPEAKRVAVAAVVEELQRDPAVVEVIDAQYGGILSSTASVLVPCRVYSITDGRVVTGGTTVDVRLTRSGDNWRVTSLHPAKPGPAAANLSAVARQVLASKQILLPPASIADVRSGQVHDTVLTAMLELAKTYRIGVSVIRSGHPINVFGTDRPSDHPRGRAFDTWQINGHAVVSPTTSRSLISTYMKASERVGSYNVGGPVVLSGAAFFSDQTHHDHIHAGFRV
ncbi:hypothetical protein GCM10009745_12960 [Kribbella yunnanensis]|uniref:Uncharacterized protein n=1 Tax=Kribbella yunnanensis TaxID=190194 RepID=A0ABN2GI51_9ACTN